MRKNIIDIRRDRTWHVTAPPAAVPELDWPADLFSRSEATVIGSEITGMVYTQPVNDLFLAS
jgi:hypothetical protein